MSLRALSIPPRHGQPPEGVLVLLHGWGASAEDVAGLAAMLDLPGYQMLFPDAPFPFPYGPAGRIWYSFPENYDFESREDFAQQSELLKSREILTEWLRSLPSRTGVPLSQTLLGGFSQGGAMTLDVGLGLPLAALLVLSGYAHAPLQRSEDFAAPVLMVHGRQDQVVPLTSAQQARDHLLSLGITPEYQEYDMGHEISLRVLESMQNFIKQIRTLPDGTA